MSTTVNFKWLNHVDPLHIDAPGTYGGILFQPKDYDITGNKHELTYTANKDTTLTVVHPPPGGHNDPPISLSRNDFFKITKTGDIKIVTKA